MGWHYMSYLWNQVITMLCAHVLSVVITMSCAHVLSAVLCEPEAVPALVVCTFGKDRTGIVWALVQLCVGCWSHKDIIHNFARSEVLAHRCLTAATGIRARIQTIPQRVEYIQYNKY